MGVAPKGLVLADRVLALPLMVVPNGLGFCADDMVLLEAVDVSAALKEKDGLKPVEKPPKVGAADIVLAPAVELPLSVDVSEESVELEIVFPPKLKLVGTFGRVNIFGGSGGVGVFSFCFLGGFSLMGLDIS